MLPPALPALAQWGSILYLAQKPNTATVRRALWVTSLGTTVYAVTNVPSGFSVQSTFSYVLVIGPGTRWALCDAPEPHPLPRTPPFPWLRSTRIFETIDLLLNWRLVNLPPNPPLQRSTSSWPYLSSIASHALKLVVHYVISDLLIYPFIRTTAAFPATSYEVLRQDVAASWGVPALLVDLFMSASQGISSYLGFEVVWHAVALLGVASGLWIEEEFPALINKPFLSTSLSEFWLKRWHQLFRAPIQLLLSPLPSSTPRPVYIFLGFLISGLFHGPLNYPFTHTLGLDSLLPMFAIFGLGSGLEFQFRKLTGKRVGGPLGVAWTWAWLATGTRWMVAAYWSKDWKQSSEHNDQRLKASIAHMLWTWWVGRSG
ncbi:hypothetical protein IAT38_004379 [Cryptococcus sp. DSM 104549]